VHLLSCISFGHVNFDRTNIEVEIRISDDNNIPGFIEDTLLVLQIG